MQKYSPFNAPTALVSLVERVAGATRRWIDEGTLVRVRSEYLIEEPELTEGTLTLKSSWEEKESWDPARMQELLRRLRSEDQTKRYFEDTIELLTENKKEEAPKLRGYLEAFLFRVAHRTAEAPEDLDARQLATSFMHEVKGAALKWQGEVWLQGVSVESQHAIKIDSSTLIRQPEARDFRTESPADTAAFRPRRDPFLMPASVLEMSREEVSRPEHDARKIANSLCLYKVGSVSIIRSSFTSSSLFRPFHHSETLGRSFPRYEYVLTQSESSRVGAFIDRVTALVPVNPRGQHANSKMNGLKFYFRSLFNATDPKEGIFFSVACLESLLLAGTRSELSFRLSQRAASLLRLLNLPPLQTFQDIKDAYKERSHYAHGEQARKGKETDLDGLCQRVTNYARLVVLSTLQLDYSLEYLGEMLDKALLDKGHLSQLKGSLSESLSLARAAADAGPYPST